MAKYYLGLPKQIETPPRDPYLIEAWVSVNTHIIAPFKRLWKFRWFCFVRIIVSNVIIFTA